MSPDTAIDRMTYRVLMADIGITRYGTSVIVRPRFDMLNILRWRLIDELAIRFEELEDDHQNRTMR